MTFGGKGQEFFGAIWRAGGLKRPVPPGSRHDVNSYGRMVRVPVDHQRANNSSSDRMAGQLGWVQHGDARQVRLAVLSAEKRISITVR